MGQVSTLRDNSDGKSRKSIVSEKSPSFRPARHSVCVESLTSPALAMHIYSDTDRHQIEATDGF